MISVDALTGLNNRSKMMQYLSDRMARHDTEKRLFLAMMDLDYFKSINDRYGHIEGDNALRMTADVLKACSRDRHHFIARYGGDEFVMICELSEDESMDNICRNIHEAMRDKNAECPYKLSISIGYTEFCPGIKTEPDFIKLADAKLYQAKHSRQEDYIV